MESNRRRQNRERAPVNLARRASEENYDASTSSLYPLDRQDMVKGTVMGPQSITMEYKNYIYPWDTRKKTTISECICAFLNTQGGTILIGIKETQQYRRTVKGFHYSEEQIQQLQKDVTKMVSKISPLVVANNLVLVKFVPVVNPSNPRWRKTHYVVKITVQKGWLTSYQKLYHMNEDYFFRTYNEVKSYNQQVDLQDIRNWRQFFVKQEQKKQTDKRQQAQRLVMLQSNRRIRRPEIRPKLIQTDPMDERRKEEEIQGSSRQGMRIPLLPRPVQRRQDQTCCVMKVLGRLWDQIIRIIN